jgi:hypothetical protein
MIRTRTTTGKREPLSVWELPKLLESVHEFRKRKTKRAKERPHYPAILAFVHRSRFAIASQIQRRFSKYLRSDRTARRHLAELESLGYLDTVQPPSPLWPKTYFCSGRGVRRLRAAYAEKGTEWKPSVIDRYRRLGFSPSHVTHELFITEVALTAWEVVQARDDLELLTTERRSLASHPAFQITLAGGRTRLVPDGMFLLRQHDKGMIACFIEADMGTMSEGQWKAKLRRYEAWSHAEAGNRWLTDLYSAYGATSPRPLFRVLTVATREERKSQLVKWSQDHRGMLSGWLWFTSAGKISQCRSEVIPLRAM